MNDAIELTEDQVIQRKMSRTRWTCFCALLTVLFVLFAGLVAEGVTIVWAQTKDIWAHRFDAFVSEAVAMEATKRGYTLVETETLAPETIRSIVHQECVEPYGLSEAFVLAMIEHESRVDQFAESPAGAIGLMQVMPFNARPAGLSHHGELYQIRANIQAGCRVLSACWKQTGKDIPKTCYCYNAGASRVNNPPAESIGHARAVMKILGEAPTKLAERFDVEIRG